MRRSTPCGVPTIESNVHARRVPKRVSFVPPHHQQVPGSRSSGDRGHCCAGMQHVLDGESPASGRGRIAATTVRGREAGTPAGRRLSAHARCLLRQRQERRVSFWDGPGGNVQSGTLGVQIRMQLWVRHHRRRAGVRRRAARSGARWRLWPRLNPKHGASASSAPARPAAPRSLMRPPSPCQPLARTGRL